MKLKIILPYIFYIVYFFFFATLYYQRIGAFGCSDQCHIFVAAYFMMKGRVLYSQIFFNHQMLMPFLSFLIQKIFQSGNLYQLVLEHHLFMIGYSFLASSLIVWRYKVKGILFVLLYESTKYYLHGNLFLPESFIVYPLIYLFGLVWEKFKERRVADWEVLLSGVLAWLVVFMREPYVPAVIFLYIVFLYQNKRTRYALSSILIFILLSICVQFLVPLKDYLFDVFEVNKISQSTEISNTFQPLTLVKIFFYPVTVFLEGKWTLLRYILIDLSLFFLASIYFLQRQKKYLQIISVIFLLGLLNLRVVTPGTMFFEAFHMLPWYAVFLFCVVSFLFDVFSSNRIKLVFFLIFIAISFSPQSFVWDKVNRLNEFNINYAPYYAPGETIKQLAKPGDTLFLDQWDDLIYWQAGLDSAYKYALYIPVVATVKIFKEERLNMFHSSSPDFYYAWCTDKGPVTSVPDFAKNEYTQLKKNSNPGCLFIKSAKIAQISQNEWNAVKDFGFSK